MMTRRTLSLLAATGSAALLLGAFAFQYLGGLAPCAMCIWQRYPHMVALAAGIGAWLLPGAILPLIGAATAATSAGIGLFHIGVERNWWKVPATCSSGDITSISAEDLMAQIMSAPLVRCDEVAWSLMGLSMANWNAIISAGLAAIWLIAAFRP